ncbi:MAG TPA: cupin domain-containing protein [Acidobacteriaceae bacterium]|jgi:quercetin dioxygenase-like cupin family protein
MWNQIYLASDIDSIPAPFPDTKGKPTVQILNANSEIGPGLLRIVMQPGDVIARHFHAGQAETLYILEGTFIDEGTPYPAGTELNVAAGKHHGPHTTNTGTTFLAMFTGQVDLTDFKVSAGVEEKELAMSA